MKRRLAVLGWAVALAVGYAGVGIAQRPLPGAQVAPATPHRTRLILKDGSYQLVMSYQVQGNLVRYVSAERDTTEEIPSDLINWDATHRWERQHLETESHDSSQPNRAAPAI